MRLRLASYNVRKAVGMDRRRDPGRVLDVINALDADVIALQEADRRLGDRPAALDRARIACDTDYAVADLARNGVSLGWHGNAMLVRRGLTITAASHIELPGLEPRGAVQVDLSTASGPLTIVGTHLGLLRPSRRRQIATIRSHLDSHDLHRTVVMGDFNEWSTSRGLEIFENAFDLVAPGRSYPTTRPIAALDRFALGRDLAHVGAGVAETALARIASDHLPVWCDIAVPPLRGDDEG